MSLLFPQKLASSRSYDMKGRLYAVDGWLLLTVPNALVRGVFDSIEEPGVELPPDSRTGRLNAHISVMRPEEIAEHIGDVNKVSERGHTFRYSLGELKAFVPAGWKAMSRCWAIEVKSPELEQLRKSYGLPKLPEHPFHITVAVRRKGVLQPNEIHKAAEWLRISRAV